MGLCLNTRICSMLTLQSTLKGVGPERESQLELKSREYILFHYREVECTKVFSQSSLGQPKDFIGYN